MGVWAERERERERVYLREKERAIMHKNEINSYRREK
jgi:hypothetical protein